MQLNPFSNQIFRSFITGLILLFSQSAAANRDEFQQWSTLNLNYKVDDVWSFNFLSQGRFAVSDDRNDIYVFRPSVHYKYKGVTYGLGGDHLEHDGGNDEQRTWQQIDYGHKLDKLKLDYRVRLEQRFIEDIKMILRGRYSIKATVPLSAPDWNGVISNEIFFNHTSRGRGPAPGFDQNRFFIGPAYRLSESASVSSGYLWRYLSRRDNENIHDHILAINISLSFM